MNSRFLLFSETTDKTEERAKGRVCLIMGRAATAIASPSCQAMATSPAVEEICARNMYVRATPGSWTRAQRD